jgi:hypothetical protein
MNLEKFPNTDIDKRELSARARVLLWEQPAPRDSFVDAITEATLVKYAEAEPNEHRSAADVTTLSIFGLYKIRDRRLYANQLAEGIETAFALLNEAIPVMERPHDINENDGYESLGEVPTI